MSLSNTLYGEFLEHGILKKVHVVDPSQNINEILDVEIIDGKLAGWEKAIDSKDAETMDCEGLYLFPGLIDAQVHFRDPGFEQKETIESGVVSAIHGGFVACVTMPNTKPACDNAQVVTYQINKGKKFNFNILPAGTLTQNREGKKISEMFEMKSAGAVALTDDGDWLKDSGVARRAYEYAATYDMLVMTHAEDPTLSMNGVMNESLVSTHLGLRGKPNASEDIATARDIELVRLTGCRMHFLHVSTVGSVEMIRRAKKEGLPITGEATPHHIALTDETLSGYDTRFKMNPPLRTEEDRRAIIEGLRDGTLDLISTDHAPHATEEKDGDIEIAPDGVVGLDSSLAVVLTELHHKEKFSLEDIVRLMSQRPAELIGQDHLGCLKKGAMANLTLVDPHYAWTFTKKTVFSKSSNSCFFGKELKGKAMHTIVNGYHYDLTDEGSDA